MQRIFVSIAVALSAAGLIFVAFRERAGLSDGAFRGIVAVKNVCCVNNKVVAGKNGWLFYQPELDYVVWPLPDDNLGRIIAFEKTLREHGMALFAMPVPNKIDIYPEMFTSFPAPHPVKKERLELMRRLERAGVRVIDVVPAFERAKAQCRLFDSLESHWTPAGIEVAARVVAERIDSMMTARGLQRATRYTVIDTVLNTTGDLLEKISEDGKNAWFGLPVRQVLDPQGNLYVDDRTSELMILGDSFVDHCRWWNAHLGAQLARFTGCPTRTYFSLLANTEGPSMYRRNPRAFSDSGIVIWAFTSRVLRMHLCERTDREMRTGLGRKPD